MSRYALLIAGIFAGLVGAQTLPSTRSTVPLPAQSAAKLAQHDGKLTVTGLDLEGEAALKRIWSLKDGAPFNPEYPDHFLDRVREDGIFDHLGNTKAETRIDAKTHVVAVTLVFSADPTDQSKPTRHKLR